MIRLIRLAARRARISPARFVLAAAVVLAAILTVPHAVTAGFNSADAIVVAAPFALLAIAWPRGPRRPRMSTDERKAFDDLCSQLDEQLDADYPRRP